MDRDVSPFRFDTPERLTLNLEAGIVTHYILAPGLDIGLGESSTQNSIEVCQHAARHHDVLRKLGMNIPATQFVVGSKSAQSINLNGLYTVTEFVPDIQPISLEDKKLDPMMVATQAVKPLIGYYEWVLQSEDMFLCDLVSAADNDDHPMAEVSLGQFSVAHDHSRIIMHDTEPLFAQLDDSGHISLYLTTLHLSTTADDFKCVDDEISYRLGSIQSHIEDHLANGPAGERARQIIAILRRQHATRK